ncbi:hypothetical protein TNCV_1847721 [Trichonephila clavipes]|nr:hypothetical protein TNCV_1847721 [Trichonephila clavipes]
MNDLSGSSFFPTETGRVDNVELRSLRMGASQVFMRTWGHETTPLRVKEDIEDVFSELGEMGIKSCTSWMKHPELYCSR